MKRKDLQPGMVVAWQRSVLYDAPTRATVIKVGVRKFGGYRRSDTLVDIEAGDRTFSSSALVNAAPLDYPLEDL